MHFRFVEILTLSCTVNFVLSEKFLPILIWHSLGATCCGEEFNTYSQLIKSHLDNDVYIRAAQVGDTRDADRTRSLTTHPLAQIKLVCDMIKSDEKFQNGYNAIGFSQGGLLIRGLVELCPSPPMRNLLSFGGPQQGIHKFPRCGEGFGVRCFYIQTQITVLAYTRLSQTLFAPATYFHDLREARYRAGSTFLAVINNEKTINLDYVKNLQSLRKFIMVKYKDDIGVVPNESTWFGYYDRDAKTITMEESELYKSDKLGLKAMQQAGKLVFLTSPNGHLSLDEAWFIDNIIPLLKET